eukprot:scaffold166001_cov12-Tisochrysis_lutea.AAC.1
MGVVCCLPKKRKGRLGRRSECSIQQSRKRIHVGSRATQLLGGVFRHSLIGAVMRTGFFKSKGSINHLLAAIMRTDCKPKG